MSMMKPEYVMKLSPESRVKNSYEALYYRVESGDPKMDEIERQEIQRAFRENDVVLADNPKEDVLKGIMVQAFQRSAKALQQKDLSPLQMKMIEQEFDQFTKNHPDPYGTLFDSYEQRYDGETVDFSADYERYIRESESGAFFSPEEDFGKPEPEETHDRHKNESQKGTNSMNRSSGLSYAARVPEAAQTTKRSYQQIRQEEAAAAEMKGTHYDEKYDQYKRNRNDTHSKFTAGDDYGFDELEDDGPEL